MEATVNNLPPAASPELTKAYHRDWLLIPIEVWPNIPHSMQTKSGSTSDSARGPA